MSKAIRDRNESQPLESTADTSDSSKAGLKRKPSLLVKVIFAGLLGSSFLAAFLIAEIVARCYLVSPLLLIPQYAESMVPIGNSSVIELCDIPGLPYLLKPNQDTLFKLVPLKTNSLGLRDKEFPITKPANTYRVAVIGDSFTMPSGVALEKSWHKLIEKDLNAAPGQKGKSESSARKNHEFINFGIGGYRFDEYVAMLEHRALQFNPDHVVIGICAFNDLPMKWHKPRPETYTITQAPSQFWRLYLKDLVQRAAPELIPPPAEVKNSEMSLVREWSLEACDLDSINNSLSRLISLKDKHGFKITLVVLRRAKEAEFQTSTFKDLADKHGIQIVDTGPSFPDSSSRWWIFPLDGHPNTEANRIFADTIMKDVEFANRENQSI